MRRMCDRNFLGYIRAGRGNGGQASRRAEMAQLVQESGPAGRPDRTPPPGPPALLAGGAPHRPLPRRWGRGTAPRRGAEPQHAGRQALPALPAPTQLAALRASRRGPACWGLHLCSTFPASTPRHPSLPNLGDRQPLGASNPTGTGAPACAWGPAQALPPATAGLRPALAPLQGWGLGPLGPPAGTAHARPHTALPCCAELHACICMVQSVLP